MDSFLRWQAMVRPHLQKGSEDQLLMLAVASSVFLLGAIAHDIDDGTLDVEDAPVRVSLVVDFIARALFGTDPVGFGSEPSTARR